MSSFELVTLRNGSRAIREVGSGEIMHPTVGPWREANHLYVEQSRLAARLTEARTDPLVVYDVGLGGGANAIAALAAAEASAGPGRRLELVSFDRTLEPLRLALADPRGFPFLSDWTQAAEAILRAGAWSGRRAAWRFLEGDVLARLSDAPRPAELVFFDPFSPKANPALWTVGTFSRLREAMDGLLFTYSAATPTRVSLLLAGLFVGAGASVATKAETTVAATRLERLEAPLGARWLERWRRSPHRAPHGQAFSAEIEAAVLAHPQFKAG